MLSLTRRGANAWVGEEPIFSRETGEPRGKKNNIIERAM
jgi:hypothetical protein